MFSNTMWLFNILTISIVICSNYLVNGLDSNAVEEWKQRYAQLVMDCSHQYPISPEDLEALRIKQLPDSRNPKCLLACAYRQSGMMDAAGFLSVEGVQSVTQQIFADDPTIVQHAMAFTEACRKVNDEVVSDGSDGCDRAALIFKCTMENAPQFDLAI